MYILENSTEIILCKILRLDFLKKKYIHVGTVAYAFADVRRIKRRKGCLGCDVCLSA